MEAPARPDASHAPLEHISARSWSGDYSPVERERALAALEGGKVILLAELSFDLADSERRFLRASCADGRAKNISFDPRTGRLGGTRLAGQDRDELSRLLARFSVRSQALVSGLFPRYAAHLELGRTSLRPVGTELRQTSFRKDDRRLHVDAFPSYPVQGRRILRVFTNVNPEGGARVWRVGESFADYARHFLPRRSYSLPGMTLLLQALRITKGPRTPYDRLMLRLHDRAKADMAYQHDGRRDEIMFPPGSTWIVYTDLVPHAAIAGQHALEQTFYLPVAVMHDPDLAPLRILERLTGRRLVTRDPPAPRLAGRWPKPG